MEHEGANTQKISGQQGAESRDHKGGTNEYWIYRTWSALYDRLVVVTVGRGEGQWKPPKKTGMAPREHRSQCLGRASQRPMACVQQ